MANRPNVIVKNVLHGRDGSFQDAIIGGTDVSKELFCKCVLEFCNRFDICDVEPSTVESLADGKWQCIVKYKMVAHYYQEFKFDTVSLRPDVVVKYDSHGRDGTYNERIIAEPHVSMEHFNKCLETFRNRTDITDLAIGDVVLDNGTKQCLVNYHMIQHQYKEYVFN